MLESVNQPQPLRDGLSGQQTIGYLLELRRRFIWIMACFIIIFLGCYGLSNELFHIILSPILQILPGHTKLITTHITTPVLIPLTLAADLAMLATAPIALFHLWRFIAPALYQGERRHLKRIISLSITLFAVGVLFCFYAVLPFVLQLFLNAVPPDVQFMPELTSTIDFMMRMMVLFGLCFQVPLICILLIKTQLITLQTLKAARRYWIVAAFVIGMLLTPPDVLSQVTLAIPLCLLYELGIVLAAKFSRSS